MTEDKDMSYDYRCYDLAATFLGDEARPSDSPELMDALRKDLAQLIQDTIEGYLEVDLEDMRRKYDAAVKDSREVRVADWLKRGMKRVRYIGERDHLMGKLAFMDVSDEPGFVLIKFDDYDVGAWRTMRADLFEVIK